MTKAFEIAGRIRNGETNFLEVGYTTPADNSNIMRVDDQKIFDEMTQEEKLSLSVIELKRPILNIWTKTWVYIQELNIWQLIAVLNTYSASFSRIPDFLFVNEKCIFHVETEDLFFKDGETIFTNTQHAPQTNGY